MTTTYIDERKGFYSISATEEEIAEYERQAPTASKRQKPTGATAAAASSDFNPKTESGKHWTQELHDDLVERGFI